MLALWTTGNCLGILDRGWKTLGNRCSPRQQSRFCLAAATLCHNCMHRHTFWCEDIDAPMHAGVQMYDACLCPIVCLNSHASGAGWRGCAGLVFLQSSRFGQAYVFAFRVLFSLGHARPFGMLHAHLLVYAYTIALGCCSSACIKHHLFFRPVRLHRLAFAAAQLSAFACCSNAPFCCQRCRRSDGATGWTPCCPAR
mgnify:CR=1 FL=1